MKNWITYLKQGLSRKRPPDPLAGEKGNGSLKTNLRNLIPFVKRHWRKGIAGGVLILFNSLLAFPQPMISRYLIDDVILGHRLELLVGVLVLLVAIALIGRLAGIMQQYYISRYEQEVILDIQGELLERTLRFPKSFFDKNQTGYLMSRLSSDVHGLTWFFSSNIIHIIENVIRFAGGVILIFYLEWKLALAVLVVIPFLPLSIRFFTDRIHALGHESSEIHAKVWSRLEEALSSVSLIKAFSSEKRTASRVMAELRKVFHLSMEQSAVGAVTGTAISFMPDVARFVVFALGAYWVITDQWTLGSLFAFQAYLGYVFGPAQSLASVNLELQGARVSLERVSALFDIVPEDEDGRGVKVERLSGDVEFRDVNFSYNGSDPVLQGVSFKVRPGERVAIVGPSGVGKTTLLSLLMRFYRPTAGEILFDGKPVSEYEVRSLRERIGYVSQSPLLLTGTVMENLRYGNVDAPENDVVRAAKVAGIHDFIAGLPAGYESEIGERGVNLSEGQKQRLSIARALVRDPDILILDEPTSALDSLTEQSVFRALPTLVRNKTLFVVAHRLCTIQDADRILLLNENRLEAIGTHESLLKGSEYYHSLVAYQQMKTGAAL